MKLPSNRHLQQIFSWKDFWNTPAAPKHFLPSSPSQHQKTFQKKTPKTTLSFKQKHNCRKTFPCLTWSSFFHPKMHWTWSSHWLLQRWDIRQWSARLYAVRKTLETEKELGGFWWFGISEKTVRVIPQKRRVPSKQTCGDKNYCFPVFPVKNTFGVTCFLFFEPIISLAKLTAHLRCHCCGYIWPEMISGGSFWWMFFFFQKFLI